MIEEENDTQGEGSENEWPAEEMEPPELASNLTMGKTIKTCGIKEIDQA